MRAREHSTCRSRPDRKSSSALASEDEGSLARNWLPTEAMKTIAHPATSDARRAAGKALRNRVPREQHGQWQPPRNRPDPVDLVIASSKDRIPQLIPVRYGRMSASPFTFFRGAALNMAADLAGTPQTKIRVQVCGDCHLMNFGGFTTPERREIFDINDFDETLPGPWEWDVKRLAASFVLAARSNGFAAAAQRAAAMASVRSYRRRIAEFAAMRVVDVWYARIDMDAVPATLSDSVSKLLRKRLAKVTAHIVPGGDLPKIVQLKGGKVAIKDAPPLVYHDPRFNLTARRGNIHEAINRYRSTIQSDRQVLLSRYRPVDVAMKVVGVGSVGKFCAVLLMMADNDDSLFLQMKEARASVLEPFIGKSVHLNHGQRVVTGQRLMQSASDLFLGWTEGWRGRHFYLRQLRDTKLKPVVEDFNPTTMQDYATLCGWTLARAHARSGDSATISGYVGKGDVFDLAIARFARLYADQTERDYAAFMQAIRDGRIPAQAQE
jgi:uncharacterized protein (DUF2252 family)